MHQGKLCLFLCRIDVVDVFLRGAADQWRLIGWLGRRSESVSMETRGWVHRGEHILCPSQTGPILFLCMSFTVVVGNAIDSARIPHYLLFLLKDEISQWRFLLTALIQNMPKVIFSQFVPFFPSFCSGRGVGHPQVKLGAVAYPSPLQLKLDEVTHLPMLYAANIRIAFLFSFVNSLRQTFKLKSHTVCSSTFDVFLPNLTFFLVVELSYGICNCVLTALVIM